MQILVVGGGVSGWEAALAASEKADRVILFCGEDVLPYRRPMLSKLVGNPDFPESGFLLTDGKMLPGNLIVRTGTTVERIDRVTRTIVLKNGELFPYDRLILSVGGDAWVPPFEKTADARMIAFREYADLRELQAYLREGRNHIMLLGGGVLSLELAQTLLAGGNKISVVESCDRPLPRNLSQNGSAFVMGKLGGIPDLGLYFGRRLVRFDGALAVLDDGTELHAELAVICCGMRPRTELAEKAEICCRRGIVTDRFLRTKDPLIFACGDCAEIDGRCGGLYLDAKRSGMLAGRNAVSDSVLEFCFRSPEMRMNALGIRLLSAGSCEGGEISLEGDGSGCFRRAYVRDGRREGVTLIGDLSGSAALLAELNQ